MPDTERVLAGAVAITACLIHLIFVDPGGVFFFSLTLNILLQYVNLKIKY